MEEKLFADFSPMDASTWSDLITKELKGASIDSLSWQTAGIRGKVFYTKDDLPKDLPQLQFENENPESEGARHWINYEVIQVDDEKLANEKAILALNSGATGLFFKLKKTPNFELLLKDVLLPYCHVAFHTTENEKALLSNLEKFIAHSEFQKNTVKGFILSNEGTFSTELIHFRTAITTSKRNDSSLELACILAEAVDSLDQESIHINALPKYFNQLQFNLQVGESYFVEIAKHRALRILVSQLASSYDLKINMNSIAIASFSGSWNEPTTDEHNYLLRASTQAMSAIIGGTNAVIIQPFYELFSKNAAQAERMARNISILLKEESYFDKAIDPSAGAYFIESITDQMVNKAWQLLKAIEARGGISKMSDQEIDALTQNETA